MIARPSPRAAAPVVVVGATGGVGRGIVAALLEAAIPVLAVARDRERLAMLQTQHRHDPALAVLPASLADEAGGAELARTLAALRRPLAGVVVALMGPLQRGRLLDRPASELEQVLQDNLLPQFIAARHLLPLLLASGRRLPFLLLGGPCCGSPWAGYGHLAVSTAALRMLVQVVRNELEGQPARVQLLAIRSPVRTERNADCACPEWPSALEVGRRVREVLADPTLLDAVVPFAAAPAPSTPVTRRPGSAAAPA